jgi:hypothetical protein
VPVEYHRTPDPPPLSGLDPEMVADMRGRLRRYVGDDGDIHLLSDDEVDTLIADRMGAAVMERPGTVILAAADAAESLAQRLGSDSPKGRWYADRADELVRHAAALRIV